VTTDTDARLWDTEGHGGTTEQTRCRGSSGGLHNVPVTRYELSLDPARLDVELVHRLLSQHAYWALGRSRQAQDTVIASSRNYGLYDAASGQQVAYARVVTDGATFAWLCDVIVDPGHRGKGLGVRLVEGVMADLEPLGLKRVLLATEDAHDLYRKFGFAEVSDPERWMVRLRPQS